MASYEFHPGDYNKIIIRQLRFIAIVFSVTLITGIVIGKKIPKRFEAKAVIQANFESFFDGAKTDPAILSSMVENLSDMMIDITGYEVLLEAAKKLGSIPESVTVQTVMENQNALDVIEKMREKISLNPIPASRQVEIKVTSKNREETSKIANIVSEIYRDLAFRKKMSHLYGKEKRIQENFNKCRDRLSSLSNQMAEIKKATPVLLDDEIIEKKRKMTDLIVRELNYITNMKSIAVSQIQHYSEINDLLEQHLMSPFSEYEQNHNKIFEHLQEYGSINELFTFDPGLRKIHSRIQELNDSQSRYIQCFRPAHPVLVTISRQIHDAVSSLLDGLEKVNTAFYRDSIVYARRTDTILVQLSQQPEMENLFDRIQRTYSIQEEMCESIEAELSEIETTISGMVPYISIVSDSVKPELSGGLNEKKVLIAAMAGGVILGLLLALFREIADRSIKSTEDMHRVVDNYPIVSLIPKFKTSGHFLFKRNKVVDVQESESRLELPVLFDRTSQCCEVFRMLGAQLCIQNTAQECSVIMVTSSIHQEGKTVTAANVSLALAQQGYQTLLLEANFRHPSIASLFGVPHIPGLSDLLLESAQTETSIYTVTDLLLGMYDWKSITGSAGLKNLYLLPGGSSVPNPVELLRSDRMKTVIDRLRIDYDYVIFDTPPVLITTDTQVLSRYCNGTLLVYRCGRAPREVLSSAITLLEKSGTPILGVCGNEWLDT